MKKERNELEIEEPEALEEPAPPNLGAERFAALEGERIAVQERLARAEERITKLEADIKLCRR